MDLSQVVTLIRSHAWLALAVFVVGFLVRLTAKDSKVPVFSYINIPDHWQPVVVLALGTAADALQEMVNGKPWDQAINAALVIGVFVLAAKAYYTNREEPAWLKFLAMVTTKTVTKEVTGPAAVAIPADATAKVEITQPAPKDPS